MNDLYSRNRIYINGKEQSRMKEMSILLAGAGIGSVIAECLVRIGFERITIIDGDRVELSNLNRQNYTQNDLGKFKVTALRNRLLAINPEAKINCQRLYLNNENLNDIVTGYDIAINALDFSSDIPFQFDRSCQKLNTPVIHPYNIGWAGIITVISPNGRSLQSYNNIINEVDVVQLALKYFEQNNNSQEWIKDIIVSYINEADKIPPPQLSPASWLLAAKCTRLIYNIVFNRRIEYFPHFYYISTI